MDPKILDSLSKEQWLGALEKLEKMEDFAVVVRKKKNVLEILEVVRFHKDFNHSGQMELYDPFKGYQVDI